MIPPIIADNFGDLLIFDSVEKAEQYLEPIDVRNSEYIIYDSQGRLLRAMAHSDVDPVRIEPEEDQPQHRAQLRRALINFLSRVGEDTSGLLDHSLEELVAAGSKYLTE